MKPDKQKQDPGTMEGKQIEKPLASQNSRTFQK
jgi:hypothetical protein